MVIENILWCHSCDDARVIVSQEESQCKKCGDKLERIGWMQHG